MSKADNDAKLARQYNIHPHSAHAPYTLTYSGLTICHHCSQEARRNASVWRRWFGKPTTVLFPCPFLTGESGEVQP